MSPADGASDAVRLVGHAMRLKTAITAEMPETRTDDRRRRFMYQAIGRDELHAARMQGMKAAARGNSRGSCPYANAAKVDAWLAGWDEAMTAKKKGGK
jgi:ribosome modulation factor